MLKFLKISYPLVILTICGIYNYSYAMSGDFSEVEYGGCIIFNDGRRNETKGIQVTDICTLCSKPLFEQGLLVTRIPCSSGHEVHHSCFMSIHKTTDECPRCGESVEELKKAQTPNLLKDLEKARMLVEKVEEDAEKYSDIITMIDLDLWCEITDILNQKKRESENIKNLLEKRREREEYHTEELSNAIRILQNKIEEYEEGRTRAKKIEDENFSAYESQVEEIENIEQLYGIVKPPRLYPSNLERALIARKTRKRK